MTTNELYLSTIITIGALTFFLMVISTKAHAGIDPHKTMLELMKQEIKRPIATIIEKLPSPQKVEVKPNGNIVIKDVPERVK